MNQNAMRTKGKGARGVGCRLGLPGYATILARIYREPATVAQLMDEGLILSFDASNKLLSALHNAKRVHVSDWQEVFGCPLRAVWAYGRGRDAKPPRWRGRRKCRHLVGRVYIPNIAEPLLAQLCFEDLLCELEEPRTVKQLRERTGLADATIRHTLAALEPALRLKKQGRSTVYQIQGFKVGTRSRLVPVSERITSVFDLAAANEEARAA